MYEIFVTIRHHCRYRDDGSVCTETPNIFHIIFLTLSQKASSKGVLRDDDVPASRAAGPALELFDEFDNEYMSKMTYETEYAPRSMRIACRRSIEGVQLKPEPSGVYQTSNSQVLSNTQALNVTMT